MKKLLFTLFVVIPCLTIGQANKLYRKAMRSTNLNEKISLLTQVIEEEPKNLDAYFQRAIAKNDLGDYHGAIVDYSKIVVEEPDADTYYNRGNSRYSIKDLAGAKEDYAKAYMLDDKFIDALYSLACVNYDLGEYEKALANFTKVIKEVPTQPNTYILRASVYTALENHYEAIRDYSTAILIDPSADNYYSRGTFLLNLNYFQRANEDLSISLRLNKYNAYAYFYRGTSNLMLGKFKDAVDDFNFALEFDSTDFDAYLGLAMSYYKLNELTKSKESFERANNILSIGSDVNNISEYSNTYWFQNQYYYFNNIIANIARLE
ncbi:tetratricopeptide repeat protein [Tamlana flava]|uniref:tetratricopeptide repeat protein n=1 Tax=Tamlana flava TaxID=3158572 RepID=UPI00351BB065